MAGGLPPSSPTVTSTLRMESTSKMIASSFEYRKSLLGASETFSTCSNVLYLLFTLELVYGYNVLAL